MDDCCVDDVSGASCCGAGGFGCWLVEGLDVASSQEARKVGLAGSAAPGLGQDGGGNDGDFAAGQQSAVPCQDAAFAPVGGAARCRRVHRPAAPDHARPAQLRSGLASAPHTLLFTTLTGHEPGQLDTECGTATAGRLAVLALASILVAYEQAMTTAELLARWEARSRASEVQALSDLPDAALRRRDRATQPEPLLAAGPEIDRVLAASVADALCSKSVFTRHELIRMINRHLPDYLGGLSGPQVTALLEELADRALAPGGPCEVILLTRLRWCRCRPCSGGWTG